MAILRRLICLVTLLAAGLARPVEARAPTAPASKQAVYSAELRVCMASIRRGEDIGQCLRDIETRLLHGELDRGAFYRAVDQVAGCDAASLNPLLLFYGSDLGQRWQSEAKRLLLRCMAANVPSPGAAWAYAAGLFGFGIVGADPARLSEPEWRGVYAWCKARHHSDCLAFVGVAAFDREFGGIAQQRAYVDSFDGENHTTSFRAGRIACRLSPDDPQREVAARTVPWNLGRADCFRSAEGARSLAVLLARVLGNAQMGAEIINLAVRILRDRPEIGVDSTVQEAVRRCARAAGPRDPCSGLFGEAPR